MPIPIQILIPMPNVLMTQIRKTERNLLSAKKHRAEKEDFLKQLQVIVPFLKHIMMIMLQEGKQSLLEVPKVVTI